MNLRRPMICVVLLGLNAGPFANAAVVQSTHSLPIDYSRPAGNLGDCVSSQLIMTVSITPMVPEGATVVQSLLHVTSVDDFLRVIDGPTYGDTNCTPDGSNTFNVSSVVGSNGHFTIEVWDKTEPTEYNQAAIYGSNEYTFEITDPLPTDTGSTNTEDEVEAETSAWRCETNAHSQARLINSPYSPIGCSDCWHYGSPRPSINESTFNLRVLDTPIWHETEVGPPLELTLRFSNYAATNPATSFGPKWSCNWNSSVRVSGTGTNVMVFPSGSIAKFGQVSAGVFLPPAELSGVLVLTNSVYQYRKPDGMTWQYAVSSGDANLYLLERVYDAWSNTVVVAYTNDRLHRVTQTVPNSGRYLEFSYSGTNARVISVSTETSALRTASFVYSSGGVLTNVTDMAGFTYAYTYTNGYLAGIYKGQVGGTARLLASYSKTPNLWTATNTHWVSVQDAEGRTRKYEWAYGLVTEDITLTTNTTRRYVTVNIGGPRGSTIAARGNVRGGAERYEYSTGQRVSLRTDKTGGTWSYTYNSNNLVRTMTDPLGRTTTNVYDANGFDLLHVIPPEGPVQEVLTYVSNRHAVATASNALGRTVSYAYNSLGLVTNAADGRTTLSFAYNGEGRLLSAHRNGVLIETNQYDAWGRHVWTRDAAGLTVNTTYDNLNRVTSRAFDNNGFVSVQSNEYDCCNLSRVIDRNGREWNFEYNDLGWLLSHSNPQGLTNRWVYGLHGEPLTITNALEWEYRSYTAEGWLKRRELPARSFAPNIHAENFVYDDEGRLTKQQGLSGAFQRYEYDVKGRRTASYVPDGSTLAFGIEHYVQAESNRYDALDRVVWARDIRGLAVSNVYNAIGQLTRRDHPDGTHEAWTYSAWGDPTSYRDRLGHVTSNLFDSVGRLIQQVDPRQVSTHIQYTDADFVSSISNATLGYVWHFEYDEEGRPTRVEHPNGLVDERWYDPSGNLTQSIRGGITSVMTYDGLDNRTSMSVGGTLVASNRYDGLGRLVFSQDRDGVVVTNLFDSWGGVTDRFWPLSLSESYRYGDRGLTNHADRLGIATRIARDTLGRALQVVDGATNALTLAFVTNGIDQVRQLWDGNNNLTAWAYDLYGNPTNKTYANSSVEAYAFDALNRVTNKTDTAGINTAYGYDANGNLTSLKFGSLSTITFGLDGMNRRTNMVDGLGTTVWTYDASGRVTSESGPLNAVAVSNQYDALGRLTAISFGGYSWAYGYDDLGRITSISSPDGDYGLTYQGGSALRTAVGYPGSVQAAYAYDALARLTNLTYSVPTGTLLSIAYAYDGGDRRTNETWSSGRKIGYGYDNAHQLLTASSTSQASDVAVYAYDKAGNPLRQTTLGLACSNAFNNLNQLISGTYTGGSLTVVGEVNYAAGTVTVNNVTAKLHGVTFEATNISVSAGSNLITAIYRGPAFTNVPMVATDKVTVVVGNTVYGHDLNGNLTNDAEFVYQYDPANRLTNVIRKSTASSVLVARYDGLGRRREVVRNGTNTERYVYVPGTWLVLAVTDGTNGVKEVYTHGPDLSGTMGGAGGIGGIMGVRQSGTSYFLHGDALGSIVLVTASNKPVAGRHYGAFGQPIAQWGSFTSRYAFTSKEYDVESGLLYFGYRYFSPKQGRWLTRDPIGEVGGINLYGYVGNTPLYAVDPLGLSFWSNVIKGDFDTEETSWLGVAGQVGVGLIPIVGQVADARDTIAGIRNVWNEPSRATFAGLGGAVVGWVPIFGDSAKGAFRVGKKATSEATQQSIAESLPHAAKSACAAKNVARPANGVRMSTDAALTEAEKYLGTGYKQAGPGRYVSADGTRQVRLTDSDLVKIDNHAGAPHMNFEEGKTIIKPNGKESFVPRDNSHVYLPEEQ